MRAVASDLNGGSTGKCGGSGAVVLLAFFLAVGISGRALGNGNDTIVKWNRQAEVEKIDGITQKKLFSFRKAEVTPGEHALTVVGRDCPTYMTECLVVVCITGIRFNAEGAHRYKVEVRGSDALAEAISKGIAARTAKELATPATFGDAIGGKFHEGDFLKLPPFDLIAVEDEGTGETVSEVRCVELAPPPPTYTAQSVQSKIRTVVLGLGSQVPEVDFKVLRKDQSIQQAPADGAAAGAVAGGTAGAAAGAVASALAALVFCAAYPPLCPSVAKVTGELLGEATAHGAIEGAESGAIRGAGAERPSPENSAVPASGSIDALNESLKSSSLSGEIRDRVMQYGSRFPEFAFVKAPDEVTAASIGSTARAEPADSHDVRLDISLVRIMTVQVEEFGGRFALGLTVNAKLSTDDNGETISNQDFQYVSELRGFQEWARNDALEFRNAIQRGYQQVAEYIVDELFLISEFGGMEKDRNFYKDYSNYTLNPTAPDPHGCAGCGDRTLGNSAFVEVDSLQPTFEWKPLREDGLGAGEGAVSDRPSDVTYELRIFRANLIGKDVAGGVIVIPMVWIPIPLWESRIFWNAADIVHSEEGIRATQYTVASPLEPCTKYLWTVRARFNIGSRPALSEWAGTYPPDQPPWTLRQPKANSPLGEFLVAPSAFFYPFATACGSGSH